MLAWVFFYQIRKVYSSFNKRSFVFIIGKGIKGVTNKNEALDFLGNSHTLSL
jgi:hypothetical protein